MKKTEKKITLSLVEKLAQQYYGIIGKAVKLNGELDLNFKISTNNSKYYLKIYNECIDIKFVKYQEKVLNHLTYTSEKKFYPKQILNKKGNAISFFNDENNKTLFFRINSWIDGRLWSDVNPITAKLRLKLGQSAGRLTKSLNDLKIIDYNYNTDWDISNSLWTVNYLKLFKKREDKKVIQYFQNIFLKNKDSYNNLRKSFIHNDINDNNIVLTKKLDFPEIKGIIDFGDTIKSQSVNDLAVTCTYAIMNCNSPLSSAVSIVRGYNQSFQLLDTELYHLYNLIGMRLVVSITKSAINKTKFKENKYLLISEISAWDLIHKWYKIDEEFAYYNFRNACDLTPHPKQVNFTDWIINHKISILELFPFINKNKFLKLDLSVSSEWLGLSENFENLDIFENKINYLQQQNNDKIISGGYLEPRQLYNTKNYERESNNGVENRTIHLGIDFWVKKDTEIINLFDGVIDTISIDKNDKGYGGLIILKHLVDDFSFYTLFGHLSHTKFKYNIGDFLKKGALIGYVGDKSKNGNWIPHLHFQLLLSKLNYLQDFPGVCYHSEMDVFKSLCPDPNLIFKSKSLSSFKNIDLKKIINYRKKHLGKNLSLQYDTPLYMSKGYGVYLFDSNGEKYLDTLNNIAHVGHENSKVVKAGQNQIAILNTNTRYLHKNIIKLTENLLSTLPKELSVVYYVNSGSEANELAIRMVESYTNQKNILVSEGGYHGSTSKCIELSHYKFSKKGGKGKSKNTHVFPLPDKFRGKYRGDDCGVEYLKEIKKIIKSLKRKDEKIGGLLLEPIISCGGQIELPEKFLKDVYQIIRKQDGVCISDEIQTGLGRVGDKFWGFELHDIIPDIVTIGKSFGNGHPISAVVCKKEIADKFNNGMEFFSSFGGNPVSCAIANEVLKEVKSKKLQQNSKKIGDYIISKLNELSKKFPIIANIRGKGLFIGFELTNDKLQALPIQTNYLVNRIKDFKILLSSDGADKNVIKIKPPIIFNKQNVDYLIKSLNLILKEDFMKYY
ncbi:aminotransferase class III-fold pyridoxal phosphate-dependent enzyme [Flavobacteriaceae bacterium]|nr:aminotransferase class III-fold pyridoxal phosphate-dependent enzyme [Flavobacteriaceae bacterium]